MLRPNMRNATRPFIFSNKTRKKVTPQWSVCVCFRWLSNVNTERITTHWRWEKCEYWHEPPNKKETWSWTRKKENTSRFSTSFANQIQSDIDKSCEGKTNTRNSNSTKSVLTLSPKGTSGPWDCPNRGARDDSRINLRRAFGSFVRVTKKTEMFLRRFS